MQTEIYEIEIYRLENGKSPFVIWLESLPDMAARAKIKVCFARIRLGNISDWKSLGGGLYEIRINEGAGYRLYFAHETLTKKIVLLGGSKKTQAKDIDKARQYLKDYRS